MPGWISYSFLLGMVLKSTTVLAVAGLAALLFRKRSAAVRHLLWSGAFAAILALPLLAVALPALRVPIGGSILEPGFRLVTNSSAAAVSPAGTSALQTPGSESRKPQTRLDWLEFFLLVWAVGSIVSFARIAAGWAAVRRLRRRSNPYNGIDLAPLTRLLGIREDVSLFKSPRGSMPITYGLLRPSIFVPADIHEWSAERRRMVLLHELAHVRRRDAANQLLARTALSIYWWNPAAWLAWREFLNERERAADDLVLNAGACASEYASHLLEIARSMQSSSAMAVAAVPMARRSQLEGRLLSILDANADRAMPVRVSPVLACLLAVGMIAPLAALHAQSEPVQTTTNNSISPNSFRGMINSGDAAREHRQYPQAKKFYEEALAVASNGSDAATAYLHLGTVEIANKNLAQAMDNFEQAKRADSSKTAEAEMWMAIAQQSQNNLADADALYQGALAAVDPNSTPAATTMELYAPVLRQEGKQEEANSMAAQASAIRDEQGKRAATMSDASRPGVYKIGGDVKPPILLSKVEPEYTEVARIAKYQGTALLSVVIDPDGIARNITVARTLGFSLEQKAVEAVRQWKFKPATKDGQAVPVQAYIEVNFRLL